MSPLFAVAILISTPISLTDASSSLPKEYQGVWKISSAILEGVEKPIADDPDLENGECDLTEIIVCEDRIILVKVNGEAMVGRAKIRSQEGPLRIEWIGLHQDYRADGPHFAILNIDEGRLQFAIVGNQAEVEHIDVEGGKQFVLTAIRQTEP